MEKFPTDVLASIRASYRNRAMRLAPPVRKQLGRPMPLADKILFARCAVEGCTHAAGAQCAGAGRRGRWGGTALVRSSGTPRLARYRPSAGRRTEAGAVRKEPIGWPRRFPIGAEPTPEGGAHFRVWAPQRGQVEVVLEGEIAEHNRSFRLDRESGGYHSGYVGAAKPGDRYRFRLDEGSPLFPDPASRYQPDGPHGSSQIVDAGAFRWSDDRWPGITAGRPVLYEMHIGTFTPAGTFRAAADELAALKDLGISVIEMLPVADFVGRFGWGYDGVDLYAPTRLYGTPDDLRYFVDAAHRHDLGVILDVVYNHVGPEGNYLKEYAADYFSTRYQSDWGESPNFDGENSGPVREFFLTNVEYWIHEFHFDGLRFDATQQLFDASPEHILAALSRRAREAAGARHIYLVGENEPQRVELLEPLERGGCALSALWNDDFHHTAIVALTGRNEAYYSDYRGQPQEFISAAKWGFLYQGQRYEWQQQPRGTPTLDVPPERFVTFLDNHDQVANSGRGYRCHMQTSPGRYRAITALLLLGPQTPMLFQGQEFAASTRFHYFADHRETLARLVNEGRAKFLAQFPSLATPEMQDTLPDPADPETFVRSKLDLSERQTHREAYALHGDLLKLRAEDATLGHPRDLDGAVLGPEGFVLRYFGTGGDDRLLLVNFGLDLHLRPAPEPLLAPPRGGSWRVLWSSEHPRYGGRGTPPPDSEQNWWIPGHAAIVLAPEAARGGTT